MALKVGELFASFDLDASGMNATMRTIENSMEAIGANMATFGSNMQSAVTAPIKSFAKDAVQAAIDYESAFAGVIKTTDAEALAAAGMTFDDLSDSIKQMSLNAPQTTEALAGIMESAGQLGIKVTSLSDFTETIAALGVATNMTTEEAASMFAQFANITGMSQNDFDRLGSTVVALGNNFATTENDIMRMSMRMASVGNGIGLAENEILAFATAISSVGIEAEAGGSSFSTFASNMQLAVETGSDDLKKYAKVAGMSAEDFKKAFKDDAAGAIYAFVAGLNDTKRNGKSAIAVLDDLGITEIRQRQMLTSLANSYGVLGEALEMSELSWQENIALMKEASQRYDTTESQIQIMKNALALVQQDLGDFALPHIKGLTSDVVSATEAFLGMDDATKMAGIKVAAVAAAIGPALSLGGQLILTLSRIGIVLGMLVSPLGMVATGLTVFALAAVDADNAIGKTFVNMTRDAQKYLKKLDKTVTSSISTVSKRMPRLIRDINKGISSALPQLTSTALNIVSSLADMLGENADELLSIGTTIIESIIQGVADSLPNLISSLSGVVLAFASALNSGKLRESAVNMAKSIIEGFKAVDWSAIGNEIITSIGTALTGIVNLIASVFTGAKDASLEVDWAAIPQKIKSAFNFASDWLKGLILGDTLTEESTWKDVGDKISGWIKGAFNFASDWLKGLILGDALTEESTWKDVGSKVWSWIKSGFTVAESWLENLILGSDTEGGGLAGIGEKIITKISDSLSNVDPSKVTATMSDLSGVALAIVDKIVNSGANFAVAAGDLIAQVVTALGSYAGWSTLEAGFQSVAAQIMTGIVNAVGKVTGTAAQVAGAIGTVLSGITLDDVTTTTASVARVLIEGIVAGIKAVVDGATLIAGAIAAVLGNINDNDWGESIGTLASNLFDAIIDGIAAITETPDMSALMTNIGAGIKEGVVFLGDIVGAIVGYILSEEGLKSIGAAGLNIAKTLVLAIGNGLLGLSDGLIATFFNVFGAAIESVLGWFGIEKDIMVETMNNMTFEGIDGAKITGHMLNNIVAGGDSSATIVEQAQAYMALVKAGFEHQANEADFTPAGVALAKAIQDGCLSQEDEVRAMAALFATGMADGFYETDYELYEAGANMFAQIYNGVEQNAEILIPLLRELGYEVPETFYEVFGDEAAWKMEAGAMDAVKEAMASAMNEGIVEAGASGADTVADAYATQMGERSADMKTATSGAIEASTNSENFTDANSNMSDTGSDLATSTKEGMEAKETELITATQALVDLMSTTFKPLVIEFSTTAKDAMIGINRTILTQRPYNVSTMTYAAQSIINAVKNILNLSAGYVIGRDLMQGMVNGIKAMSGTLASAARRAVSYAISAMRRTAQISSPSKVTEEIGGYLDEGAAIGILGGQMAKAAATAMANTVREFSRGAYVTDLSRGTVATSRQAAQQNAEATADRLGGGEDSSYAREVGRAMADRLIETGVLNRKIVMNEREVGEEVADPVSQKIDQKAKRTISGRSAQGVLA